MLIDYLKENKISIYSLSKKSGIPYSTLNDFCNGKVEINNCKVELIVSLGKALGLCLDNIYEICTNKDNRIKIEDTYAQIKVKNKRYYVEYNDLKLDIFKANKVNTKYVKDAAKWLLEEKLIDEKMEKLYAVQLNAKR